MEYPKLTEPGVRYFLTQSLKECRKFKERKGETKAKNFT